MTKQLWASPGLHICSIIVLQFFLLLSATASDNQLPGHLISPQIGVVCNEKVKVCYDTFGVSIGITKDIMGESAAERLTHELSRVPANFFDRTNFKPVQGISCHTLEKACYDDNTINKPLSSAFFDDDVGKYGPDALIDVPWAWDGSRYNNDTEITATDGRNYRLNFHVDGSLKILADCNRVFGRYTAKGKSISITLGPTTLMACGPDSQDQQFLRDLEGVAVWFLKKGDLYLDIKADTGTMRFYRGVAP
ncbi:MAG: META domain-containing protein [Desulfobulbaceae bacterium]|nr:META domain-containing protein [Desulfobulbaceae bacterium]